VMEYQRTYTNGCQLWELRKDYQPMSEFETRVIDNCGNCQSYDGKLGECEKEEKNNVI
jgi:hypothetical protein